MIEKKAALAIRTAYNNQGWAERCKNPLNDLKCFKCVEGKLFVNWGKPIDEDENGYCKGNPEDYPLSDNDDYCCWEQVLCKKFFWGNVRGQWRNVWKGMPVYFLYAGSDRTLTLWGHSKIERFEITKAKYPPIFFKPFEPFPKDKWIKGLTGSEVTGQKWGQLHYRYLDEDHKNYLASLLEGKERRKPIQIPQQFPDLNISLKKDIIEKLQEIALSEGREVPELIREAVAKLIREREV